MNFVVMAEEALLAPSSGELFSSRRVSQKRRCILVATVLVAATLIYFCGAALPLTEVATIQTSMRVIGRYEETVTEVSPNLNNSWTDSRRAGFVIDTPGCRIPDMAAKSDIVSKYIQKEEPSPKCEKQWSPLSGKLRQRGPPLIESNLTSMWVVHESLPHYNVSNVNDLECCYRPFTRVKERSDRYGFTADNHYKMSKTCVAFSGDVAYVDAENEEYVRVECTYQDEVNVTLNVTSKSSTPRQVYKDFHAFIPIKRKVEERCMQTPHQRDEVSVLIVGIDAVSRLNMERELPLLQEVLTSSPIFATPLLGYNKVGDNTFPNLVPLLTGLAEDELTNACPWPSAKHKLDPCPFLWKKFAAQGFRTGYGEDCTWMSSFNYAKTGFVENPADYYARPFLQAAENEQGHSKRWNVRLCVGPRLALSNILSYVKKFSVRFANERSFGFFWSNSVSHDFLTMPHNGDKLYSGLFTDLANSGALKRTVLVVLSDHGIRWGGIRETYQGRLEERLPFAYISFPKWFQESFPTAVANFRRNSRNRLTTPYDVYETLHDLLEPEKNLESNSLRERSIDFPIISNDTLINSTKKGISLFLPIPTGRTCKSAHIPPHFCTCQESSPMLITEPVIERSVDFVISEINEQLSKYHQCAQLKLEQIKNAQRNVPLDEIESTSSIIDYVVTFVTQPGSGVFEATVRETPVNKNTTSLQLAGFVSRINRYGNQSKCVADFHMKLYCFCT